MDDVVVDAMPSDSDGLSPEMEQDAKVTQRRETIEIEAIAFLKRFIILHLF